MRSGAVWLIPLALAVAGPAVAGEVTTDAFGDTSETNTGGRSYKLDTYRIDDNRILHHVAPYLRAGPNAEVVYVVYVEDRLDDGVWNLEWQSGRVAVPEGEGFAPSPDAELPLQSGRRYAMGVYLLDSPVQYFWDDTPSDQAVGWGAHEGAVWADNGTVGQILDPLDSGEFGFAYHQEITVETPDDLDADGYDATVDCDDDNDTVFPGADEVCDGLDNDCDGDLGSGEDLDADLDGWPDCGDCEPDDADAFPGADEDPCDVIDRDCDGEVPSGDQCDGDGPPDSRLTGSKECGCSAGATGSAWALLVLLPLLRQRRR